MTRLAMIDGAIMPIEQATVSVLDRGFLYGDSVFETLRTYGGQLFRLGEHLSRLERSAALVHIEVPISRDELTREVMEAVHAAANPESYVRVMITRGSGELGLDPSLAVRALRVMIVTPLQVAPVRLYEQGIRAITFPMRRAADGTAGEGAKIGNYLVSVLAMRAARAANAGEALIVDGAGRIVEGATSNVFFVDTGAIVTAPEDAGILSGITRSILLEIARELGISVELRAPQATEIAKFDEVFVSSSIRELLPVVEIDETPIGNGSPGPIFRRLLGAFRAKTRHI